MGKPKEAFANLQGTMMKHGIATHSKLMKVARQIANGFSADDLDKITTLMDSALAAHEMIVKASIARAIPNIKITGE